MTYVISEMPAIYFNYLKTSPTLTMFYSVFTVYMIFYILGISWYAANHFLIKWREQNWKAASDNRVLEEVKYIILKHNEYADLDTMESAIHESINLTKYSQPYRIECFQHGLKHRVRMLESV
jgi:hypothetical protein